MLFRSEDNLSLSCLNFYNKNKNLISNFKIELFHDNYISGSLETNHSIKVIIPCNLFNFNYEASSLSDFLKINDIINSKISGYSEQLDKIIVEPPAKLINKIQTSLKNFNKSQKSSLNVGNIIQANINGVKGS